MATARLINPREVEDGTAWTVDTWPVKDGPFEGPLDRDWDDFRVTSHGATYQWRTPADRVCRAAEQVEAKAWTLRRALKDPAVQEWLGSHSDTQLEVLLEDDPGLGRLSSTKQDEALFREFAATVGNEDWYGEDDDAYLSEAAEALDLPRWARVWRHGEGGPGSGFTAAAIVLAKGKSLDDLAAWLSERACAAERRRVVGRADGYAADRGSAILDTLSPSRRGEGSPRPTTRTNRPLRHRWSVDPRMERMTLHSSPT